MPCRIRRGSSSPRTARAIGPRSRTWTRRVVAKSRSPTSRRSSAASTTESRRSSTARSRPSPRRRRRRRRSPPCRRRSRPRAVPSPLRRPPRSPVPPRPAPAAPGGGAAPPPAPAAVAHAPAVLDDLSDAELAQLVVRLDHELDDAREALIARYLQAARLIARAKRQQPQAPALSPRPGVLVTQRPPAGPHTERPHVQPPQAKPHGGEHSAPQHSSVSARNVQVALNAFTRRYLKGFAPLVTDGKVGPATKQRIRA